MVKICVINFFLNLECNFSLFLLLVQTALTINLVGSYYKLVWNWFEGELSPRICNMMYKKIWLTTNMFRKTPALLC